jgi:hypothetical protein
MMGRHWNMATSTRIDLGILEHPSTGSEAHRLRDYIQDLIARFEPNHYSVT